MTQLSVHCLYMKVIVHNLKETFKLYIFRFCKGRAVYLHVEIRALPMMMIMVLLLVTIREWWLLKSIGHKIVGPMNICAHTKWCRHMLCPLTLWVKCYLIVSMIQIDTLRLFLSVCKLSILSIKLKYPGFFSQLFDMLCFILSNFYESKILFCFTHTYMQITLPWWILLETKMSPLISQMLAFLGTLFILTIKTF